jgi:hypothetical protein
MNGKLLSHVLRYQLAMILQAGSIVLGLFGAIWHGFPSVVAGLFMAWIFHLAKPNPDDDLDDFTGRGS